MKIIIAGAGNVGTHLAKLLSREKQDIISCGYALRVGVEFPVYPESFRAFVG